MREKIERFSKGDFEFELPFLCLSDDRIDITVEAGKVYEGSLTIGNSTGRSMKGVLYSSHRLFMLDSESFCGVENKVSYRFNATFLKAGDELQGELSIVSDCGEHKLPFHILIEAPYCTTSLGRVKDLFQFANLARMDWTEAKKVFRSEDFERVILRNDEKFSIIYHSLLKNISTSQALEEFLIAIHKKSRIELSIDKTSLSYEVTDEEFMDKLILTKNHWGYAEIRVSTDAPFIKLEQKFVWADRFIGNTHQISFIVVPQHMKRGNNYGRIYIKTVYETIVVELVCRKRKRHGNAELLSRKADKLKSQLTRNYLELRMDQITPARYTEVADSIMMELPPQSGYLGRLMNVHLALIAGKNKIAGQLLTELAKEEAVLKKTSAIEHGAYLYLEALYRKDDETIRNATDTIRRYYTGGHFDWSLLWFLLYTDRKYEKNKNLKLADIKEQFEAGCRSPILYYEALLIFEEEPFQLRELGDFEIQIFNFGISYGLVSRDAANQYAYLANKRKNYHTLIFRCLTTLYEKYASTDILTAICCMLIKGMKKSMRYYKWFRLGVEAQLRITELYEYYIYSADEALEEPLAQPVLLYFIYNSSLNDRKRAFLYANIIRNKEKNPSIYRTYYKRMEVFALKQVEAHNISPNLAVLYREFMDRSAISSEMSLHLPYVIFTQELHCENPNMVTVTVIHRERKEEENVPLSDGKAYIQLYTRNSDIFLLDAYGNRYSVSVEYELKPLLPLEEQEYLNLDYQKHPKLLLHILERYQNYRILNDQAIALRRQVLELTGLQEDYATACLTDLVDYYYENYHEELLEQYLGRLKLELVKDSDRIRFLEYMVIRRHFDKALGALMNFGFEGISLKRLVKMCSAWIKNIGLEYKQELLISLSHYIFSQGKYDEAILCYLVKHYNGPTDQLLSLWKSAKGFELETHQLEERLLVQMLFTGSSAKDSFRVFDEYYRNVSNHHLVRAFLTFQAYQYLVHDQEINDELLPIMRRELNYEENDICLLAWMKYHGGRSVLSEGDYDFIAYHINQLERKGILLPFFMDYAVKFKLPDRMTDKFYIEYKTSPGNQVYLHYRLMKNDEETDFVTERLQDTYLGIHVKELVLFYQEVLQYYITEEADGKINVTDTLRVINNRETIAEKESRFGQINRMLIAREKQDDKALLELLEHYVRSEYMIANSFTPII